ncbi:MAG: hypothetical protein H8E25_17000 [Planctomycetes bacterium]|nr:hypothetical protein [Planctomycetota bacterium]
MHTFHIPVMATGFTVDTPLKVTRFGIASVVSMVDDIFLEQVRERVAGEYNKPFVAIGEFDEDSRARRITAYLNLLHEIVGEQFSELRESSFEDSGEIVRYCELLPDCKLRDLYLRMTECADEQLRLQLQDEIRNSITVGPIDVNIMTKLDRDFDRRGKEYPKNSSDALSALRGFMNSDVDGAVVLSAGMNRRLFSYVAQFDNAFPDENGYTRKRIILKVSDYRSALVQGKMFAKLGLHVAEYRVESGLNCGGHAFGGKGQLMGPVLSEFCDNKQQLFGALQEIRLKALAAAGRNNCGQPADARITAQGGIGDYSEDSLLRENYQVDGTGWGSSFLFVPEVTNIDDESMKRIIAARSKDISLSPSSPLGVPFWSLLTSVSEQTRLQKIVEGSPGSKCPKGFLAANTEFTKAPICTASRAFQRRKLNEITESEGSADNHSTAEAAVVAKACICHDLAGVATIKMGIDPTATASVCCGPNAAYFEGTATLKDMANHIYGRLPLPINADRPHMFINELRLSVDFLREDIARCKVDFSERMLKSIIDCRENLERGVEHYRKLAANCLADKRDAFVEGLDAIQREISELKEKSAQFV